MEHLKIIPRPTNETKVYWEACQQQKLLIQQCKECEHIQFYPRLMCTKCSCREVDWIEACGLAKVLTYTIVHRPILPAYQKVAPYILAVVQLDEGPTMMTNIVNCPLDEIKCDMNVKVMFQQWSDDFLVPVFEQYNYL
ncbi:Zn-ribbon domain-containing OB-fold protein [Ureibacillus sp. NPDC094379]